MQAAVIIMSKIPRPGFSKTRLLQVISPEEGAGFQSRCIEDTVQMVRISGLPCRVYYALPDIEETGLLDLPPLGLSQSARDYARFFQQKGRDLGERICHAIQETLLVHPAVVVIGTDLPDINMQLLHQSCHLIEHHDIVLGPCQDGGYYLIAAKSNYPDLFQDISWGSSRVLHQTLQKVDRLGLRAGFLESGRDIDTWDDMLHYYRRSESSQLNSHQYACFLVHKYQTGRSTTSHG